MFGLAILALFGSVCFATLVVIALIRGALQKYETDYLEQGQRRLSEMFIFIDARRLLLLATVGALLLALLGTVLFNWFVGLILLIGGFLSPRLIINHLRRRRVDQFDRQLVDALNQMAAAFRAGLTFPQAAEHIAQDSPGPLGDEFRLLVREIKVGVAQDQALDNLAERVQSESIQLVATSTNIARQLGGNIAEMYEIIAKTVRERFEVEGRVRSLTAMGRMQAWVVGAMPLVVGLVFNAIRPDLMGPMLESSFGKVLVALVVALELAGIWLVRRMVDIEM